MNKKNISTIIIILIIFVVVALVLLLDNNELQISPSSDTVVITIASNSSSLYFCDPNCDHFRNSSKLVPSFPINMLACAPNCFIPKSVSIDLGDTVTFHNTDIIPHIVVSGIHAPRHDSVFSSSMIDPGQTYNVTFAEKGVYKYFTYMSLWMEGVIIVGDMPTNLPLIANAGNDQIVLGGSKVFLLGSSTNTWGEPLEYYWRQLSGEYVHLGDSSSPGYPSNEQRDYFIAPKVSVDTVLTFEFTVKDGLLRFTTDTVSIIVTNNTDNLPSNTSALESLSYADAPDLLTDLGILTYTNTGSFTESINSSGFLHQHIRVRISNELQFNRDAFDSKIIKIKIFDKECVAKKIEYFDPTDNEYYTSWYGKSIDQDHYCREISMSLYGPDRLSARILTKDGVYLIDSLVNGNHIVQKVDLSSIRDQDIIFDPSLLQ